MPALRGKVKKTVIINHSMKKIIQKIKDAPPEQIHDRFALLGILLSIWAVIQIIELIIPKNILSASNYPVHVNLFFIIVLIMSVYAIVIFSAQRKRKPVLNLPEFKEYPAMDLMVCAYNEEDVIKSTLENLVKINYSKLTIWIINDRSTDNTAQIVQEFINNYTGNHQVKLHNRDINSTKKGKAVGLNEATKISTGEYIIVCDADAQLEPDCLKRALPYFYLDARVGAIQFQKAISNKQDNLLTLCQDLELAFDTYLQAGRDSLNGFVELRGNGLIVSRKSLTNVGLWCERSLTEDLELSTRMQLLNWKVRFIPEIIVLEQAVINPKDLIKQRRRWAEGTIRRYLMHLKTLLAWNNKLSLKQKIDIIPFLAQFAVPMWVFLDFSIQLFYFLTKQATYFPLLTFSILAFSLIFWVNIITGILYWRKKYTFWNAVKDGTVTFFYGAIHWPAIVLWTIRKVIFGRRPTEWVKTPRSATSTNN